MNLQRCKKLMYPSLLPIATLLVSSSYPTAARTQTSSEASKTPREDVNIRIFCRCTGPRFVIAIPHPSPKPDHSRRAVSRFVSLGTANLPACPDPSGPVQWNPILSVEGNAIMPYGDSPARVLPGWCLKGRSTGRAARARTRGERLHGLELNPGHEAVRYRDHHLRSPALTQHRKHSHGQLLGFRHQ